MSETIKNQQSDAAWDKENLSNPHEVSDKAERVNQMFASIAPSYDINNRVHSMGMDQGWRRKLVKLSSLKPTDRVVDVACGTGDLAMAFAEKKPAQVLGLDFTHEMLTVAREKDPNILYADGDAMNLPLADESYDVLSIAFGIRNVTDPGDAIKEFYRVLRPGGRCLILECAIPTNPILRFGYNIYFHQIVPRTATLISGDRSGAYRYLPQSVNTFLNRGQLLSLMQEAGFKETKVYNMNFGVAAIYYGLKD